MLLGEKSLQSNISHSASTKWQHSLLHIPCHTEAITSLLSPSPGNTMAATGGRMVAQYLSLCALEGTWCSKKETAQADAIQWAKPQNPQGFCCAKKKKKKIKQSNNWWGWGKLENPVPEVHVKARNTRKLLRQSSTQWSWSKFCSSPPALWAYTGENQSRI